MCDKSQARVFYRMESPREISRHVYLSIKQKRDGVYGKLKSLKYKPSPIPSGGLEVPLLRKF